MSHAANIGFVFPSQKARSLNIHQLLAEESEDKLEEYYRQKYATTSSARYEMFDTGHVTNVHQLSITTCFQKVKTAVTCTCNVRIMAYGSTPYVGMTPPPSPPQKWWPHLSAQMTPSKSLRTISQWPL